METIGFARTHVGRRPDNEDSHVVRPDIGLFVVADGMGGHEGGAVASTLASDTVHHFFERIGDRVAPLERVPSGGTLAEELMGMAFRLAHREVSNERFGTLSDIRTTLAAVLVRCGQAVVAHVGDSRVYRFHGGDLERLTRDHSLYAEVEATGVAAALPAARAFGRAITRAIGPPGDADPDVRTVPAEPGDLFLLCTDGLTDVVEDDRIRSVLQELPPEVCTAALVSEAWVGGSRDDITVVLAHVGEP